MTADGQYRDFLEAQPLTTLRDWALDLARERHDVAFAWDLVKQLPDTHEANLDWAVYDPVDAVRELVHLVRHFKDEAPGPEGGGLRAGRRGGTPQGRGGQPRGGRAAARPLRRLPRRPRGHPPLRP